MSFFKRYTGLESFYYTRGDGGKERKGERGEQEGRGQGRGGGGREHEKSSRGKDRAGR